MNVANLRAELAAMDRAIALARRSAGHTRPNPPVGAVLVASDGRIVSEGRHVRCGAPHAEAACLAAAGRKRVSALANSPTLFCTLEPCSRPGRVGACTDAIVAAGVKRVVWAVSDPNPKNRNRAAQVLRRHGISTECWERSRDPEKRARAAEAAKLVAPFSKHVLAGLPYVTVKIAMSLDGRICDDSGAARWISSPASRRETAKLRETADVVMVGAETVRRDNPSLLCHTRKNDDLFRVVVTRSGRLPKNAQIFTDAAKDRTIVLRVGKGGFSDLRAALRHLGDKGFMHVLCEGGLELARALAAEGLVDEWIAVVAPKVIGHGSLAKAFEFPGADRILRF